MGRHLRRVFRAAGLADCQHRTWTIDRQAPLGPEDRAYFAGYLQDLREKADRYPCLGWPDRSRDVSPCFLGPADRIGPKSVVTI